MANTKRGLSLTGGMWLLARPDWTRGVKRSRKTARPRLGRFLAVNDEPIAVLLIGMRINRWLAPARWVPVALGMPGMIRELTADPDGGLLGYRMLWGPRFGEVTLVQYWRRAGDIRDFAHDPDRLHRPAQDRFWGRYLKSVGAVGIWHEMYSVRPGAYQCLYGDMPASGVGAVTGLRPVVPDGERGGYQPSPDPVFTAQIADLRTAAGAGDGTAGRPASADG
jgi:hypothetical protein